MGCQSSLGNPPQIICKHEEVCFVRPAVSGSYSNGCTSGQEGRHRREGALPYENCNCQCHHYTWQDTYGKIQGNCKSSDGTRGRWCYVEGFACDDIQYSKRRRDQFGQLRKWSYQACSTPAPGTGRCAYGGGYGNDFNSGYNNGCNERHGNCNGGFSNNRPVYNNNNNYRT